MKKINTEIVNVLVTFRGKKFNKQENKYTYQTDDGGILTFMANPKKTWDWQIFKNESNDQGIKQASKIIEYHIDALL